MRTFWDQVVALVEQGDRSHAAAPLGSTGSEAARLRPSGRAAALQAQCEDIGRALDHLERLKGLFQDFLTPVSELVLEFDACNSRLEETTKRLAALEEAHQALAARHAATLDERDRLAERAAAFDVAQPDRGDRRDASEALQRLVESVSRESALRAGEIERLSAELDDRSRALAESETLLRVTAARCAALEAQLTTQMDPSFSVAGDGDPTVGAGERRPGV